MLWLLTLEVNKTYLCPQYRSRCDPLCSMLLYNHSLIRSGQRHSQKAFVGFHSRGTKRGTVGYAAHTGFSSDLYVNQPQLLRVGAQSSLPMDFELLELPPLTLVGGCSSQFSPASYDIFSIHKSSSLISNHSLSQRARKILQG